MNNKNNTKHYALSQIFLLIVSLFAIAFIIGETNKVSAADENDQSSSSNPNKIECLSDATCVKLYGSGAKCTLDKSNAGYGKCTPASVTPNSGSNKKQNVFTGTVIPSLLGTTTTIGTTKLLAGKAATSGVEGEVVGIGTGTYSSAGSSGSSSWLSGLGKLWSGESSWGFGGQVMLYAAVAIAAGVLARYIAPLFGASTAQAQVIGYSVGVGVFAGLIVASAVSGPVGWIVGAVVVVGMLLGFYKKEPHEIVAFQCLPYKPVSGGEKCELCNNQDTPCTEYQCKSLGRGCEIVNPGTADEMCTWKSRGDLAEPVIQPWEDVLTDGYIYNPIEVAPGERGVKITTTDGKCVKSFTKITFGITLDELAECKYSTERTTSYEEMGSEFFSSGMDKYNHSISITFPDRTAVEAEDFVYDEGFNEWFIRCNDVNGNANTANFVVRFCVDESPDLSPPTIIATNPLNNAPLAFNTTTVNSTFYLNKPADCKWDHLDKSYEDMLYEMACAQSVGDNIQYNNSMLYPCETSLTGLVNYQKNDFYIRCKSYPMLNESQRVIMAKSYKYTLQGTRPLAITDILPNETVSGSAETIPFTLEVRTMGGANEGMSVCYYSTEGVDGPFAMFYDTGKYIHTQELFDVPGEYTYTIKCVDAGGNIAINSTNFSLESDTIEPIIARAYYEDGSLKLVTNEEAECVYSLFDCEYQFNDGTKLNVVDNKNHFVQWDTSLNLYVKCQDIYGNQPIGASDCSIIVRPEDFLTPKQTQ